jgi:hypothetical protein
VIQSAYAEALAKVGSLSHGRIRTTTRLIRFDCSPEPGKVWNTCALSAELADWAIGARA